jgi:hypothetical protein
LTLVLVCMYLLTRLSIFQRSIQTLKDVNPGVFIRERERERERDAALAMHGTLSCSLSLIRFASLNGRNRVIIFIYPETGYLSLIASIPIGMQSLAAAR